jgi:dienelactone hydrolase
VAAFLHRDETGGSLSAAVVAAPVFGTAMVKAPSAEPLYLGDDDRPWFAWLHRPAPTTAVGVGLVIVPPFGYEAVCAHLGLRHLAEAAARAGVVAVRIDLDGTGDSAGDDLDPDRATGWRASIAAAADLARANGASRIVFAGVRLGAALAAQVAGERNDTAGLVAIAPATSGKRWLREMRVLQQAMGVAPPPGRPAPGAGDEATGFALTEQTRESIGAIDLERTSARPAPAVLLLDRHDLPPTEKWIAHLRTLGAVVDARLVSGYTEMVLDPHKAEVPTEIIAATVEFALTRPQLATEPLAPKPKTSRVARLGTVVEEPVTIDGYVRGILTRPATGPSPRRALVLLNAGCVRRIGPNRLHVMMARRYAASGTIVLRVDLSGIGDSPPRPGMPERLVYHDHALDEIEAILGWCSRAGIDKTIVAGLCSGGYYALKAAAAGQPLAGIVVMNPGQPGTALDAAPYQATSEAARYSRQMFNVDAWKKLLRGGVKVGYMASIFKKRGRERVASSFKDIARRVGIPLDDDLGTELLQLARANVAMTFLFCSEDPALPHFRERAGSVAPRLEARSALEVRLIEGPDHTFTPRWSHALLLDEVERALDRVQA